MALNNATFPAVPAIEKPVVTVEKSAVTGSAVPLVPAAPVCTKMYFPGGMMVLAGKEKILPVLLPHVPVADPYSNAHPPILTGAQPEL